MVSIRSKLEKKGVFLIGKAHDTQLVAWYFARNTNRVNYLDINYTNDLLAKLQNYEIIVFIISLQNQNSISQYARARLTPGTVSRNRPPKKTSKLIP